MNLVFWPRLCKASVSKCLALAPLPPPSAPSLPVAACPQEGGSRDKGGGPDPAQLAGADPRAGVPGTWVTDCSPGFPVRQTGLAAARSPSGVWVWKAGDLQTKARGRRVRPGQKRLKFILTSFQPKEQAVPWAPGGHRAAWEPAGRVGAEPPPSKMSRGFTPHLSQACAPAAERAEWPGAGARPRLWGRATLGLEPACVPC